MAYAQNVDEGISSVVGSRLADLARGFIFKARPIIIMHSPEKNETVTLKLKRSILSHSLVLEDGAGSRVIAKNPMASILISKALVEAGKYLSKGYIEI